MKPYVFDQRHNERVPSPTIRAEGKLTACPNCRYRFTEAATECPICGGPVERFMVFERVPLNPPPLPPYWDDKP